MTKTCKKGSAQVDLLNLKSDVVNYDDTLKCPSSVSSQDTQTDMGDGAK